MVEIKQINKKVNNFAVCKKCEFFINKQEDGNET